MPVSEQAYSTAVRVGEVSRSPSKQGHRLKNLLVYPETQNLKSSTKCIICFKHGVIECLHTWSHNLSSPQFGFYFSPFYFTFWMISAKHLHPVTLQPWRFSRRSFDWQHADRCHWVTLLLSPHSRCWTPPQRVSSGLWSPDGVQRRSWLFAVTHLDASWLDFVAVREPIRFHGQFFRHNDEGQLSDSYSPTHCFYTLLSCMSVLSSHIASKISHFCHRTILSLCSQSHEMLHETNCKKTVLLWQRRRLQTDTGSDVFQLRSDSKQLSVSMFGGLSPSTTLVYCSIKHLKRCRSH